MEKETLYRNVRVRHKANGTYELPDLFPKLEFESIAKVYTLIDRRLENRRTTIYSTTR